MPKPPERELSYTIRQLLRKLFGRCSECGSKEYENHGPFWGGGWPHRCKGGIK